MSFVNGPIFNAIVSAAKYLDNNSKGAHRNVLVRTIVGFGNTLSGASQLVIGLLFKCSKDHQYNTVQSKAHIERGIRVFKQGVIDVAPAVCIGSGAYLGAKAWNRL
ncbi:MAG: hypothetical protein K1X28_01900 [Parachlamydiales bacterium]|nr:hypothetical protein [Parachlamydiales bacterium]